MDARNDDGLDAFRFFFTDLNVPKPSEHSPRRPGGMLCLVEKCFFFTWEHWLFIEENESI